MPKIKDYGTNNREAFTDDCEMGGKHEWKFERYLGKCFDLEYCWKCGALHRIDSSD